jgi:hypothetical protein
MPAERRVHARLDWALLIKDERAELVKHQSVGAVDGLFKAAAHREVPGAA